MEFMEETITYDAGELHYEVTKMLNALGFSPRYSGYNYTREAVKMAFASGTMMRTISKTIYPAIAKISGTSPYSVEHGIYKSIIQAWKMIDTGSKQKYFGKQGLDENWRPTNSELVYTLADKLRCDVLLEMM